MSDPLPLPEDPSRWPKDPWQVLGVSRQADRREVRRAYAKLIRVYKPEHKPAEFRLVRDAYERIDGFLEFRDAADEEPTAALPDMPFGPAADSVHLTAEGQSPPAQGEQEAVEARIDRIWKGASASPDELAAAYRAYGQMFEECRADEELCLRLYWLLRLWPDLDAAIDCHDWLVRGMQRHGVGGRLLELYRREIERTPEEALSQRMMDLAKAASSPQRCWELLAMRWQAASLLGRRDVIPGDLRWAQAAIAAENPEASLRLVLMAMDHLAWAQERPLSKFFNECRREVAAGAGDCMHLEYELDRAEYLCQLAANWRDMQDAIMFSDALVRPLARVIEQSWTQPFSRVRLPLTTLLLPWLAEPAKAMDQLSELGNATSSVIHWLYSLVDSFFRDRCDPELLPAVQSLQGDAKNFLWLSRQQPYAELRRSALAFCLHHRVTAEMLAEAVAALMPQAAQTPGALPQQILGDLVLRVLAKAALAVWPEFGPPQGSRGTP